MTAAPVIRQHLFQDAANCAAAAAAFLAERLGEGLGQRGFASLAVSGGRTPRLLLPMLAARPLAWERIQVTLTDERRVPLDHPESNEGLARALLPKAAQFIGLNTGNGSVAAAEARLAMLAWPLDAIYLGMGEDGHIASLFPQGPEIAAEGLCVASHSPAGIPERISLTADALLNARAIALVIGGAAKRRVFEAGLEPGPNAELPVRLVLHQAQVPVDVFIAEEG